MPDKLATAFNVHEYSANLASELNNDLNHVSTVNRDLLRSVVRYTSITAEMIRYTEWFLKNDISEEEFQSAIQRLQKGKL